MGAFYFFERLVKEHPNIVVWKVVVIQRQAPCNI